MNEAKKVTGDVDISQFYRKPEGLPAFEVELREFGSSRVRMDGKDLNGVRDIKIAFGMDGTLPVVTIEFQADSVTGIKEPA